MNSLIRKDPFDDLFRGFFVRPVEFGNAEDSPTIRMEVHENPQAYTVHAELPGIKKEDIHVHVDGSVISIAAERKQETEVREGEHLLRSERSYGKISRSVQLGHDVDEEKASGRFTDGVLELTLPKKAASQAHKLTIE